VWDVIGDFERIRKWAPAVMSERIEQTREGKVRVLALPPEGREVRELLWAQTDYSYTYKFLGDTPNARNYLGTISVVPLNASLSRIELRSDFEAAAGLSDEEAVANMTKGVRANLRSMTKALGLPRAAMIETRTAMGRRAVRFSKPFWRTGQCRMTTLPMCARWRSTERRVRHRNQYGR
jgi:hypothetical protein